jgi:hypothetical protein
MITYTLQSGDLKPKRSTGSHCTNYKEVELRVPALLKDPKAQQIHF